MDQPHDTMMVRYATKTQLIGLLAAFYDTEHTYVVLSSTRQVAMSALAYQLLLDRNIV